MVAIWGMCFIFKLHKLEIFPYEEHTQFLQTSSKLRVSGYNRKLKVKISQYSSGTFLPENEVPMNEPLLLKSNIFLYQINSK
jgi:hypothetical protein